MVRIALPTALSRYVVEKGSITVDGVSLTVSGLGHDWFEVSLIPTTLQLTTLGRAAVGTPVNLEVDIIAKYVERLLDQRGASTSGYPRQYQGLLSSYRAPGLTYWHGQPAR